MTVYPSIFTKSYVYVRMSLINIYTPSLDGLAVDWLTNKLYWTEATPETISVLDLVRGHRLILFSLPESSIPRGIALDPMNG